MVVKGTFLTNSLLYTLISKQFFSSRISNQRENTQKINYIDYGGNTIAKFIGHQILANTLILKFFLLIFY